MNGFVPKFWLCLILLTLIFKSSKLFHTVHLRQPLVEPVFNNVLLISNAFETAIFTNEV
jgi:hypothetical protein